MDDDTWMFALGLVVLIGVIAVAVMVLRDQQQAASPQLSTYNVVRDDQGRIQSVETINGVPLGGQGGQQRLQRPEMPAIGPNGGESQ